MMRFMLLMSLGLVMTSAFQTQTSQLFSRRETQLFGGSSGYATTVEGKKRKGSTSRGTS